MTSLTRHLERLQAEIQKVGADGEVLGIPAFPLAYELSLAIQLVKARIDEINLTPPAPIVIIDPRAIENADEILKPRCLCPSERVRNIIEKGGTCPMGGCPYGGDF